MDGGIARLEDRHCGCVQLKEGPVEVTARSQRQDQEDLDLYASRIFLACGWLELSFCPDELKSTEELVVGFDAGKAPMESSLYPTEAR